MTRELSMGERNGRAVFSTARSRASIGVVRLVAVVLATFAAVAHCDETEDSARARALYEQAVKEYNTGSYETACALFREGYQRRPDPAFLFNLGQCHRQLGHYAQAAMFYKTYLRVEPDAPNRGEVEQRVRDMERAASAPPAGVVAPGAPPPPPPPPTRRLATTGILTVSSGAVLAVVGAVLLAVANGTVSGAASASTEGGYLDMLDMARGERIGGGVLLGAAVAAVVAGVIVLAKAGAEGRR